MSHFWFQMAKLQKTLQSSGIPAWVFFHLLPVAALLWPHSGAQSRCLSCVAEGCGFAPQGA
jgi:hypothetical protein